MCIRDRAGGGADSHHKSGFEHDHGQNHEYSHEHRGLTEILEILRRGSLSEGAAALAEKIFRILAGAEAKAHGVPEEQVHFHEVGAVDSILDIAAAAICMDNLEMCIRDRIKGGCHSGQFDRKRIAEGRKKLKEAPYRLL